MTVIFLIVLFYYHHMESGQILSTDILSSEKAEELLITAPPELGLLAGQGITLLFNG